MKTKRVLRNASFALLTVVALLVILELFLTGVSMLLYPRLTISDPALGWKYKSTSGPVKRQFSASVSYELSINSDGFRDDEFATGDEFKVMVLGDSMTFGMEVAQDETFSHFLEGRLRDVEGSQQVDVMNLGITNFSTTQESIVLEQYEPKLGPDAVILVFFEVNDFKDNITVVSSGRYAPHYVVEGDSLVLRNDPSASLKFFTFLRDYSTLFFLIDSRLVRLTKRRDVTEQETLDLTKRILRRMQQYLGQKNIPFFLFYIRDPNRAESRFLEIEEFCVANDLPMQVIPLRAEERVAASGHWNRDGHEMAASIIAETLLANEDFTQRLRRDPGP